jgi:ribosomal protein S18 acetylase RimI-like enzyme
MRLRPLREDEFAAWRERTLDWYAKDLVAHAGMTEAEARAKSEADASTYPRSPADEGHSVFVVEEEGTGEPVGTVWFAERRGRGAPKAWVYSVEIEESRRGRGYGRRAMELVEEEARRSGLDRIELNVFGGNEIARSLYRSLGYAELSIWMGKDLS